MVNWFNSCSLSEKVAVSLPNITKIEAESDDDDDDDADDDDDDDDDNDDDFINMLMTSSSGESHLLIEDTLLSKNNILGEYNMHTIKDTKYVRI